MTTYSIEYEKAREVRSNAVMAIRSARTLKEDAETHRDDLLPILFGQGTDQGIMSVIALYMEQARLLFSASQELYRWSLSHEE